MLITGGIIGLGATYLSYKISNKERIAKERKRKEDENKFRNTWKLSMKYSGIKNKNEQTFSILKYIPRERYGCDAIISIPLGMDYNDFIKILPTLEVNLGSKIVSNLSKDNHNSAYIRVYNNFSDANKEDMVKFKWYKLMQNDIKLSNKDFETFNIIKYKENDIYGYDLTLSIPDGLSYETIIKSKMILENTLKGFIIPRFNKNNHTAELKVLELSNNKIPHESLTELKWYGMLSSLPTHSNYQNDNYETFYIKKIAKQDRYGFDCEVEIPNGLSYDKLKSIQSTIESSFKAHVYMTEDKFNGKALLKVITKPIDDKFKFTPVETRMGELYFGMTHYYEEMRAILDDFPHVLISGATGTGKSVCMQIAITNEMYWHPTSDFYFAQLTDKQDFEVFRNCKKTKCIATTVQETLRLMLILKNIQKQRNEQFMKLGVKNITTYNKKSSKKMNYVFLCIDEMPEFMPKTEKIDGKEHDYKVQIQELMNKLVKQARNVGIFILVGIQRPDLNDMLPNMKANFRVKLAFSQENSASSKVVCDNDDAVGLPKREGLFMMGDRRVRFKTLYFTDDTIKNLLKDKIEENHQLINLNGTENINVNEENENSDSKSNKKEKKTTIEATTKSTSRIKVVK